MLPDFIDFTHQSTAQDNSMPSTIKMPQSCWGKALKRRARRNVERGHRIRKVPKLREKVVLFVDGEPSGTPRILNGVCPALSLGSHEFSNYLSDKRGILKHGVVTDSIKNPGCTLGYLALSKF